MIIHRCFTGPIHLSSANVWGPVSFAVSVHVPSMGWQYYPKICDVTRMGNILVQFQTCQPLRILRNHYAFRMSNTPLRKPVQNVRKLRILRNFGAICPMPRNLHQLSWLAVNRKSPAGQNIDKDLFILRLPSASASDFATQSTKEAAEVKLCPMKRRADREPF